MRRAEAAWIVTLLLMVSANSLRADAFEGTWRSLGYGQVLEISGDSVQVYQDVGGRVLESRIERARREAGRLHLEIVPWDYASDFTMSLAGDMLVLAELETGRELLYERLVARPPLLQRTSDPKQNLEYLLALIDEVYPAFEDRNVDWGTVASRVRSKLTDELDEDGLFELCLEALDGLGRDGHVGITGPGGQRHSPGRAQAPDIIRGQNRKRHLDLIRSRYLSGSIRETANGQIFYGYLEEDVGYINVLAVSGMAEGSSLTAQRESLSAALDELWGEFRGARHLVLDLRHNGGGYDALSLMVAGLFADTQRVAFSKRVRIQGTDRFTEPRLFHVRPRERSLAGKPLSVLTGPGTASGAEILVMATMQLPNTRRVGTPTMGILSDTILRELPNGWTVRLYGERYYSFDGGTFEGSGIPVQKTIGLTVEHLDQSRDPVLEAVGAAASTRDE